MVWELTFLVCVFAHESLLAPWYLLEEIISRQFHPGQVIVFSLPPTIPSSPDVNGLFANISDKATWPLIVSRDSQSTDALIPEPQHGYVIFLFPDQDVISALEDQIDVLQTFSFSYNRRGKFIIIVLAEDLDDSRAISKDILISAWMKDNIVNAIVIVRTVNEESYDIYSLFPYRSEHCGQSEDVELVDQWTLAEGFRKGNELMVEKLPDDLMGCTFNIITTISPPFVVLTENYTDEEGNKIYSFGGINLVFLNFIREAMNFSIEFKIEAGWDGVFSPLMDGKGIAMARYAMVPQAYSYSDVSIPYIFSDTSLYVPCAKQNPTSGNVLKVFTTSVWLVSVASLLLVAILFFVLQKNDLMASYNTLSSCVLNVWAIFLSISVPSMPLGTQFRLFFILCVCFCLAVNTIFQSFFTSFLIDPGYERQIKSIEDMNEMGLLFFYNDVLSYSEELTGIKWLSRIKNTKLCVRYSECAMNMMRYRNSSFLANSLNTKYWASVVGVQKLCTAWLCIKLGFVILVSRGHPVLTKFDFFIRKCLENGFFERYWSLFLWNNTLASAKNNQEHGDSYIAFGVSHLQTCFLFLIFGYILSICIWVCEHIWYKYYDKGNTCLPERSQEGNL